jgi:hypothetical protein
MNKCLTDTIASYPKFPCVKYPVFMFPILVDLFTYWAKGFFPIFANKIQPRAPRYRFPLFQLGKYALGIFTQNVNAVRKRYFTCFYETIIQSVHAGTKLLIVVLPHLLCRLESLWRNFIITISWSTGEINFIVFLQMTLIIRVLNGLNYSNLLSGHAFFRMTNICEMNI